MSAERTRIVRLCGERALGCGPCELLIGHDGRHLCGCYAHNGVVFHDGLDPRCGCHWCEQQARVEAGRSLAVVGGDTETQP